MDKIEVVKNVEVKTKEFSAILQAYSISLVK